MTYSYFLFIFLMCIMAHAYRFTGSEDLSHYKQPDNVDDYYHFAPPNNMRSCTRECIKGDHRICYYDFNFENYAILTAACGNCTTHTEDCFLPQCVPGDGYEKSILTANRRLPGPGIHVCVGDIIIVDINNSLLGRSVTIHWHGIIQKNRIFMDGIPFITQCPILDDTKFRYAFKADNSGTMYWHSHSAVHKLNGLQGGLIVREPKNEDPNSYLYDYDLPAHVLVILDWTHSEAESRIPGLIHRDPTQDTTFYLINGKGRYKLENGMRTTTPYHKFQVTPGIRYRFRVISAVSTQCPARLSIERHKMLVIATDGVPVRPVRVDSIDIYSGERYDFVLHATEEISSYWIQVRGMEGCFRKDVCQPAIIAYEGTLDPEPLSPLPSLDNFSFEGTVLNPHNASCGYGQDAICISQLSSLRKVPKKILKKNPDFNLDYRFGFHLTSIGEEFQTGKYIRFLQTTPTSTVIPWMNKIQMVMPPSPLQSQFNDVPKNLFCPNGTDGFPVCPKNSNSKNYCTCLPIFRIPLGSVVQIVLIDETFEYELNHPFHLHGHTFNVLSMGYLPAHLMNAKDIGELLKHNYLPVPESPVYKDTLAIPARGYAVIRFIADNPGFWFFHCHFVYHHAAGMGTILQVGNPADFPAIPKGFPKCGDYVPTVKVLMDDKL